MTDVVALLGPRALFRAPFRNTVNRPLRVEMRSVSLNYAATFDTNVLGVIPISCAAIMPSSSSFGLEGPCALRRHN